MEHSELRYFPHDLGDRIRRLNDLPVSAGNGRYVLCWVQQALRAHDNPLLDAAIALGNDIDLPVVVYHGLRQDYPHASDRLHRFILGASRDLQRGCTQRGLRCVTYVEQPGLIEKGLVYRLAQNAAAVMIDDQPVFVARQQAEKFANRANVAVFAIDAARLVPTYRMPPNLSTTKAFRSASGALRPGYEAQPCDLFPTQPRYEGELGFQDARLGDTEDRELDAIVARCAIDHSLPAVAEFPASRQAALDRLQTFASHNLARYADGRNTPCDSSAGSMLSPYLHFGVIGPREVTRAVRGSNAPARSKWKFLDELLTWREWFHYLATFTEHFDQYEALPTSARNTLDTHSADTRPALYSMEDLTHGRTADQTWNAAQRQWLVTGYMHNNLRMYWGKQIIKWTADPRTAWQTACHLNDRLALDGRDSATYGNMQWVFGRSKPGWKELPVYGWVAPKSDTAIMKRQGMKAWIEEWSTRTIDQAAEPLRITTPWTM